MSINSIPPKNYSKYRVEITLGVTPYKLDFYWNSSFEYWAISIYNNEDEPILLGRKINNGAGIFRYLNLEELPGEIYPATRNFNYDRIEQDDFINDIFTLLYVSEDEFGEDEPQTLNLETWALQIPEPPPV